MIRTLLSVVQFDKRKSIVGAALAALTLVICCTWFSWRAGVVFAGMFFAVGCLKLKIQNSLYLLLFRILWASGVVAATCLSFATAIDAIPLKINLYTLFLNVLCILIPCGTLFIFTGKGTLSIIVGSFIFVFLSTANGLIYQFRGKELTPIDILSLETAINVAGQYKIEIHPLMVYGWFVWFLLAFSSFCFPYSPKSNSKNRNRLIVATVVFSLSLILWFGSSEIPIKTWDKNGTITNGYYLNFFLGIRDSFISEPKNYSSKTIKACEQLYNPSSIKKDSVVLPNIIVIMDESYADFQVLGKQLTTNQPVTPFLSSLSDNTIKGYALSSVYGGNTANAEFEFLSGHSMAFLPRDSVPYQQYIQEPIFTLVWLLASYGYTSAATHPYYANGWSRDHIYPYLGFSEFSFIDSYPNQNLLRNFISDQEMFEYVIKKLTSHDSSSPLFLFGITMQNHSGYSYEGENYSQTIYLDGYSQEYPKAEQYLSLIHETDAALEYLLTTLEDYPEDTVVLFFGDHFPRVESELYQEHYGKSFDTLDEQMLQYMVPFVLWANFDIQEQTVACTSLNYLSRYLLEIAGFELPPYYQFLADMENVVPAMNAQGYYSVAQNGFIPYDEAAGEEAEWLNKYAVLQYNNLFDSKNRSQMFYAQYISQKEHTHK